MPDKTHEQAERQMGKYTRAATGAVVLAALFAVASPLAAGDEPFPVNGVYGRDDSASGLDTISAAGFNTVTGNTYPWELDELYDHGLRAVVWLGEYNRNRWGIEDDASRCRFLFDDQWIRERVGLIAGHPAILAYQIADEPSYAVHDGCDVARDLRARSDLVKSLDPSKPTYVTVPTTDGVNAFPYATIAGSVDILGLVVYPCSYVWDGWGGCQYNLIDESIAAVEAAGVDRYWGVVQGFGDGWYRAPVYQELREQVDRWGASRAEGTFILDWDGIAGMDTGELRALGARFIDVPKSAAFYREISWLADTGITQGCNPPLNDRFCPNDPVSRGQMAAFIARALGYRASAIDFFVDDHDSVFEDDINRIAAAGVTTGCNPPLSDRFCPNAFVTRGQMAAFLVRALGLSHHGGNTFVDDDGLVFETDIEKLAAAGITRGCNPAGDRYCPHDHLTRAEMAAFLARSFAP